MELLNQGYYAPYKKQLYSDALSPISAFAKRDQNNGRLSNSDVTRGLLLRH